MALEASAQRGPYVHGVCERRWSRAGSGLGWIKGTDQQSRSASSGWWVGEADPRKWHFQLEEGGALSFGAKRSHGSGQSGAVLLGHQEQTPDHSRGRGEAGGSVHVSPKGSRAWSGSWERCVVKTEYFLNATDVCMLMETAQERKEEWHVSGCVKRASKDTLDKVGVEREGGLAIDRGWASCPRQRQNVLVVGGCVTSTNLALRTSQLSRLKVGQNSTGLCARGLPSPKSHHRQGCVPFGSLRRSSMLTRVGRERYWFLAGVGPRSPLAAGYPHLLRAALNSSPQHPFLFKVITNVLPRVRRKEPFYRLT